LIIAFVFFLLEHYFELFWIFRVGFGWIVQSSIQSKIKKKVDLLITAKGIIGKAEPSLLLSALYGDLKHIIDQTLYDTSCK
jgi:hypothetical protein